MIKIKLGERILGLAWSHPWKDVPLSRGRDKEAWVTCRVVRESKILKAAQDFAAGTITGDQMQVAALALHAPMVKRVRFSLCEVFEVMGDKVRPLASGATECSSEDNFVEETGRKVSLTRALREAGFDRLERQVIWHAYRHRPRGKVEAKPTVVPTTIH